jgi:hypothetical protein
MPCAGRMAGASDSMRGPEELWRETRSSLTWTLRATSSPRRALLGLEFWWLVEPVQCKFHENALELAHGTGPLDPLSSSFSGSPSGTSFAWG